MNLKTEKILIILAIFLLILALVSTAGYYFWNKISQRQNQIHNNAQKNMQNDCIVENPDSDGYLVKICKYLKAHEDTIITSEDPTKYNIKSIEDGEYQKIENGKEIMTKAIIVRLDCCYMGDIAYIDKETKEVIGFSVGDK